MLSISRMVSNGGRLSNGVELCQKLSGSGMVSNSRMLVIW